MIGVNGETLTSAEEKANGFKRFFTDVGKCLASKVDRSSVDPPLKTLINSLSIFFEPVDEKELISYIASLKNKTSPGPDGITASLIKTIHVFILKPMVHIINSCFETGIIPDEWKESHVTFSNQETKVK